MFHLGDQLILQINLRLNADHTKRILSGVIVANGSPFLVEVVDCLESEKLDVFHTLVRVHRSWRTSADVLFVRIHTGAINTGL